MIVSWNWLQDYVDLAMSPDELALRLAMAGLNHESTTDIGDDVAIDIEITSNRPDCLGHIGIAREVAVLWQLPLQVPNPQPPHGNSPVSELVRVRVEAPELCPRYTARLLRNVTVGPSPSWLVDRLNAIGVASINNVVDATNYVLMECGQPLHAFDYDKVKGGQIVVRHARKGEKLVAIDHRTYELDESMCVIADASSPVALAGVMGGADSEVSETTTNILIESADFAPLSVRTTARLLRLHSPSSYRFERGVDDQGIDWASRRCCELILQIAGGELADGCVDVVAVPRPTVVPVTLRYHTLKRILGIDVPPAKVEQILTALGLHQVQHDKSSITVSIPSWRRDLTREADLVEEVARVYGYDQIPEDVGVSMVSSRRSDADRAGAVLRDCLIGLGFDEAYTTSVVSKEWSDAFHAWTTAPALTVGTAMLRGADHLRRSLLPSLLAAKQSNEAAGNSRIELFETARVYLAEPNGLPQEPTMLGIVSGRGFFEVKGAILSLLQALHVGAKLKTEDFEDPFFTAGQCCRLTLAGNRFGFLGHVSDNAKGRFSVRSDTVVAELRIDQLLRHAVLIPQYLPESTFPAIRRELNLIVPESVRWSQLEETIQQAGGDLLSQVDYLETYRDPQKDGPDKKRILFSFTLRSDQRTLTSEEAELVTTQVVDVCRNDHQAVLLG
ncbi:MAG: phenylalanine--tRNA ligase subunit beta [Pirellulaceae bacterium]|nr:phenylalanine--tRNA ligase subunit beta [Planctomycetales bacterium]